ncbi:hypothetical protein DL96DRAFT_1814231 [Flagelloscypha sp. PMI_526]|nr:hypothetical protein DL96DRAFT_1814231 [Flagelloscypha sp. PMI_526]
MEPSHNLPLDVLRVLFEFSASASFETAKELSLVSKEVQHWFVMIDPHLFQIIQGSNQDSSRTCLLDQMCMSDASPRLVLARNYVRAVAWELNVRNQSDIEKPLEHFPNLVQICLWRNIFPHQPNHTAPRSEWDEITQAYPSLRRVSNISGIIDQCLHLILQFTSPILVDMPSLTHLSLPAKGSDSERDTNLALSRVRDSFPPSLVLCLLALKAPFGANEEGWIMEIDQYQYQG